MVTLTGFADSYAEKIDAEAAVKRVRGVRAVANDIEVRLLDERTDPEIAREAVLFHPSADLTITPLADKS